MPRSTTRKYTTTVTTSHERYIVDDLPQNTTQNPNPARPATDTIDEGAGVRQNSTPTLESRTVHVISREYTKTRHRRHHAHSHRDWEVPVRPQLHRHAEYHGSARHYNNTPAQYNSAEDNDHDLAQKALMEDSANWTLEQVQEYFNKMAMDEKDAVIRACPSPIPDQSAIFAEIHKESNEPSPPDSLSSSMTLIPNEIATENATRRVRFDVPESVNPMRVFQPYFKEHTDNNKYQVYGHLHVHPEPLEVILQSASRAHPTDTETEAHAANATPHDKRFSGSKTYFPKLNAKLNGLRPFTKIATEVTTSKQDIPAICITSPADSSQSVPMSSRDQEYQRHLEALNMLNEEEGKKFIRNIIDNRLADVDHKIDSETDNVRRKRWYDLKKDLDKFRSDVK